MFGRERCKLSCEAGSGENHDLDREGCELSFGWNENSHVGYGKGCELSHTGLQIGERSS